MSSYTADTIVTLENAAAVMAVDLYGGAIVDFHLRNNPVNPLSFRFSKEQMPQNNKDGAVYQGHFLCAGRWGSPSAGEVAAGMPDHGEPANIQWSLAAHSNEHLVMEVTAGKEGLHIRRTIKFKEQQALCHITEELTNINNLGRLFQLVQHPTIAAPFLNAGTVINCNAAAGFDYRHVNEPEKNKINWPYATTDKGKNIDIRNPTENYNAVFSFTIDPADEYGWVTAYTPSHALVLGYLWQRKDYAWINLWQHFNQGIITYRGLEFGTTGLHQPFNSTLENNHNRVFGESTIAFIDAGEKLSKEYACFLLTVPQGFNGVKTLRVENSQLLLSENNRDVPYMIGNINF